MTLFNPEFQSIQADINYHEEQIKEAEERLDQIKVAQAYSDIACGAIEDCIQNIDPFYLPILKGHIENMFSQPNNEVKEVKEKEPAVFNPPQPATLDSIDAGTNVPHTPEMDEEVQIIKLLDNVVFDEDTDCIHIGFRLSSDGYAWQNELIYKQKLSSKSWFEESEHLEDYPKELIIEGISLEQARKLVETCDFSAPPEQEPLCSAKVREEMYKKPHYPDPKIPIKLADYTPGQTPVNKVEIAPGIIYVPVDKTAFIGMKAKGRARTYGDMLTRVLTIGSKYLVTDKLSVIKDSKYEFRIFDIELEDIIQLAKFNLSKEYDAKENKEVREDWRLNRQRPAPVTTKPSPKLVPLNEVKLGDIVYLNSIDNQYKVLSKVELDGIPHIEVICVFNSERPSLVSATSFLKECYLVPVDERQIDPKFQEQEDEEVLTEDVNIYIPKPKAKPLEIPVIKLSAADTVHRGIGDSQYEVIGTTRKDNDLYAECRLISSSTRAASIGNTYFFKDGLYLVEESVKPEPVAV